MKKISLYFISFTLSLTLFFSACSSQIAQTSDNNTSVPKKWCNIEVDILPFPNESFIKAIKTLSSMTLKEKIYQMIITEPEALTGGENVVDFNDALKRGLEKHPVGGIIYFAKNLKDPVQTKTMLNATKSYALYLNGIPLFTCVDEEGGTVARIGNNPAFDVNKFPNMKYISNNDEAYTVGNTIGKYLNELGFNVDFAPDADVLTNNKNKVIGDRSFGNDAKSVTEKAYNVAKGLHDNGILSCYKHFPGHGATVGDTHIGFAYTNKTLDELKTSELLPFYNAVEQEIPFIMTAHITLPNITGDNTPSSLSSKIVNDILRNELKFKGLIITDGLNMGAITKNYTTKQAAVLAVKAGNDILLLPNNLEDAVCAIYDAVQNGEISESRIDQSVLRIILTKQNMKNQ